MRAAACAIGLLVFGLGCGRKEEAKQPDEMTRRQRDSVIGASRLPGARGVQKALAISDSADARRAREDSIATHEP
ncbi:MAG TPA: hypothetical protein VIC59_03015 [Gemmatimonadota bacterium]|jgi:hypothetical protein